MVRPLTLGLVQMRVEPNTFATNIEIACQWLNKAKAAQCNLVLFPEIHLAPFFPQYKNRRDLAISQPIDSKHIARLQQHCRDVGIAALPNVYLEQDGKCYDATIGIDAYGEVRGVGKMVHVAQLDLFYEQDYYTPSDTGFQVFEIGDCKLGVVVCFDRHFSESYRECVMQGAEIILIPTANTKHEPLDLFEAELRGAAFQNSVFIAMANRVGREDAMKFAGESIVVDPRGRVVAKASDKEELIVVTIDLNEVQRVRDRCPYLSLVRDRLEGI